MSVLLPAVSAITRRLQAAFPDRPLKGLSRLSKWATHHLPRYSGVITLPAGPKYFIDTAYSAETEVLFSGVYQTALNTVLKRWIHPGSYCLDIGANTGLFTVMMAHWCGPRGQVAAFEANPAMLARIKRNVILNNFTNVTLQGDAIDRTGGEATFYIAAHPGKSSLLDQAGDHQHAITVKTTTIDRFVSEQVWDRLDVIKSDIEGNDCNALLGGQETIRRFRPFIALEYWASTPPDIRQACFSFLEELGYTFRALTLRGEQYPVHWQNLSDTDVDILCKPGKQ